MLKMNNKEIPKNAEYINITCNLMDVTGKLIPRGVTETLTVFIYNELAVWYLKDKRLTKLWADVEIKGDLAKGKEQTTFYLEKLGKVLKRYKEGTTKEQIQTELLTFLNNLHVKNKKITHSKK